MKKTTVRFAAVGTVLLLSALAIALAQHDSRQRPRDGESAAKSIAEAPQPILVDAINPSFLSGDQSGDPVGDHVGQRAYDDLGTARPLVRANDNPALEAPPSLPSSGASHKIDNPLRPAYGASASDQQVEPLGAVDDASSVGLASGEGEAASLPSSLAALPSLPTDLGTQPLPVGSGLSSPPSLSGSAPSLPSAATTPSSAASSASSAARTAPPGWVNSSPLPANQNLANQNLSDTQRPAMPATSLPPAGRAGQQSWLQAPSTAGSGPSSARPSGLPAGRASAEGPGAVGTATAAAPSGEPVSTLPGTARSRLSDAPPPSARADQPQGLPALPSAQAIESPVGTSPHQLGGRPLAPAASLGTPQPYSPATGSTSDHYQDVTPPGGLNSPQSSSPPTSLPGSLPASASSTPTTSPLSSMAAAQPRGQLASGNARSLLAGTALGSLVSNQPGNRHLDGSQNPIMLIQKRTAGECQVGKPATIVITVRNSGNATAHDVQVIDSVPSGASFAEAIPAATPTPEGVLVWSLGEMAPGDERTINLQIIPERQGELGSVASVRFAAQASVRTLATLPKLELQYTAAPDALIGSQHAINVVVKNVGTGVARNVRLEADLPANIRHESGDAGLEASFGDIAPGETKNIRLDAIAAEPGAGVCTIRALTDDGLQQEQKIDLQVLAPALQATINGPSKRYLDRQATFEIMIQNTGTATATNCEFMLRLPAGLNFNTANNHGSYKADEHAVLWSLPELPAGATGSVELTVLPVEVGTLAMTFQAMAELGAKAEARSELTVEEQAELAFTIEQDADPIELSASTTYTVEVRNIGRVDHHVQLTVQLPPGSKILKVDPPVKYSIQGDQLIFEPVPEMPSRAGHKFRFEVQHAQVGTQIVRAQLKSQNRPTPVIKEEATDVYNDRN